MFYYKLKIYWKKILWNHPISDPEKNDVMRTGGIVKQTYSVKNVQGANLKLFKKLHVNIFHENVSKFQIYFSETFSLYPSFYVKL